MSQQLRQLKTRIRSVQGTWKVTRAMEMVSMSKYKALDNPLRMGREYFNKMSGLFARLIQAEGAGRSIFLNLSSGRGPVGILLITSDTGLCASYNNRVIALAEEKMAAFKAEGRDCLLYVYGRKGANHFRRAGVAMTKAYPAIHGRPKGNFHAVILEDLLEAYTQGKVQEIHVVHTVFYNAMKNVPVVKRFLPVEPIEVPRQDVLLESSGEGILKDAVPLYLSSHLRLMMLESLASEHASRMVAMKAAKDNAKELSEDLILLRNKVRQTIITKEVIEIISSAEALKG